MTMHARTRLRRVTCLVSGRWCETGQLRAIERYEMMGHSLTSRPGADQTAPKISKVRLDSETALPKDYTDKYGPFL
jgi:hypothetical protein